MVKTLPTNHENEKEKEEIAPLRPPLATAAVIMAPHDGGKKGHVVSIF